MEEKNKKTLKQVTKYALISFAVLFAVLLYFLYNPPRFVINAIREQAEVQILKATDLHTDIDRISSLRIGIFKQSAVAEGIRILKNNNLKADEFIVSEKLEIEFNALRFLFQGLGSTTLVLNIYNPVVDLKRDKEGLFDVDSPLFQPEKKETEKAEIPVIHFNLQNGLVRYTDETFPGVLKLNSRVPVIKANIVESSLLTYQGEIVEEGDNIKLSGNYNTETGKGSVKSDLAVKDLGRWMKVFVAPENFYLTEGAVNLELAGSWDAKFSNLKFKAGIEALNIIGKFPFYRDVLVIKNLKATATESTVDVDTLIAESQGSQLLVTGESKYNGQDNFVNLLVNSKKLDLNRIIGSLDKKIIPDNVRKLGIKGTASLIDVKLTGTFPKLNANKYLVYPESLQLDNLGGKVAVANGEIADTTIKVLRTSLDMDNTGIEFNDIYAAVFNGTVKGNVKIKDLFKEKIGNVNSETSYYDGSLTAQNINLDSIFKDYDVEMNPTYRPYGNLFGNIKIAGKLDNPAFTGNITSPVISFDRRSSWLNPIRNVKANAYYDKNTIYFTGDVNSVDFGATDLTVKITNNDILYVKADSGNLRPRTIQAFVPDLNITRNGLLDINLETTMSMKRLNNSGRLTPAKLVNIISGNARLRIADTSLRYRTGGRVITSTDTDGYITLVSGNGNLTSKIDLNSNEFGDADIDLTVRNASATSATIRVTGLPVGTVDDYILNFSAGSGYADINASLVTNINALDNITAENFARIVTTSGRLDLTNTNFTYKAGNNVIASTNTHGSADFNISNGVIKSDINLTSREFGKTLANLTLADMNQLRLQLNADNMPSATIAKFVPNLNSAAGTADIDATISTYLNAWDNPDIQNIGYILSANGTLNLQNTSLAYRTGSQSYNFTGTNGLVDFNIGNGVIDTEFVLTSNELRNITGSITSRDMAYTTAKLNIDNLTAARLADFVPGLTARNGLADVTVNINTNLRNWTGSLTPEKIVGLLSGTGNIVLTGSDLRYRAGSQTLVSDNTSGNIKFVISNGIITSDISLTSLALGNASINAVIRNLNQARITLDIDDIDTATLAQFVPGLNTTGGNADIAAVLNTNLNRWRGNLTNEQMVRLIDAQGVISLQNTNLVYALGNDNLPFNAVSGRISFNIRNGIIDTDFDLASRELGQSGIKVTLTDLNNLNLQVNLPRVSPSLIAQFIPGLEAENGIASVTANLVTNLNSLKRGVSLNELRYRVSGTGMVKLQNTDLYYQTTGDRITSANTSGDIFFDISKGVVYSQAELTSNELGNTSIKLTALQNGVTTLSVNMSGIAPALLAGFIPNLEAAGGTANLAGNFTTSLNKWTVNMPAEKMVNLINGEGTVNILNSDLLYRNGSNNAPFTDTDAYLKFTLANGNINAELNADAREFDTAFATVNITGMDKTILNLRINDILATSAAGFIPGLRATGGQGDIAANLELYLKRLGTDTSLDALTYAINGRSSFNFENMNLIYSPASGSGVNITNGRASINLFVNNGLVDSDFVFSSTEFGESRGNLDVNRNRVLQGRLVSTELPLANLSGLIPGLNISEGTARFNLTASGDLKKFENDRSAIAVRGNIDLNNMVGEYSGNGSSIPLDLAISTNSFIYDNGVFRTDSRITSGNLGQLNANLTVGRNGDFSGRLVSDSLNLSPLSRFFDLEQFQVNAGTGIVNVDFKGNIEKFRENPYNFIASGRAEVNNLNIEVNTNTINNLSEGEDVLPSDETVTQNLNNLQLVFNWSNGLVNIRNLAMVNGSSRLTGSGTLDLNKLASSNAAGSLGELRLASQYFDMTNFPLARLAGIRSGEIKDLKLTANLTADIKNSYLEFNGQVDRLSLFKHNANIENVDAFIKILNRKIYIDRLRLVRKNSYFNTFGFIDINNLSNPIFNLNVNSKQFPIEYFFALIPEVLLEGLTNGGSSSATAAGDFSKAVYKLPNRDSIKIFLPEGNIALNDLMTYWNRWSLEPLTEEEARNMFEVKEFWNAVSGKLTTNLSLKGTLKQPVADAYLILTEGSFYGRSVSELYIDALYDRGALNLDRLHVIETDGGFLNLKGRMARAGNLDFEGEGKIDLNWLEAFVNKNMFDVEGKLLITLDVDGSFNNPELTVSLDATDGVINNVYFDKFVLLADYNNKMLNLVDATFISGGKEARASGEIPIGGNGIMSLSARMEGESLGLVNLVGGDNFEWIKGTGDAFVNVSGTMADPLITGRVNVENASVFIDALNQNLEDVNLNLDINNHFVRIERADALLNDSLVSLFGQVDLIGFRPGFLKLKMSSENFTWKQENISVMGKVDVRVTNTISEPLIGGKILINEGSFALKFGGSDSASDSTAISRDKKKKSTGVQVAYNNLEIEVPESSQFWVNSPFFALRPFGDINLQRGLLKEPEITGFMAINEGNLFFLNNEFDIIEATADFTGKDFEREQYPINPTLSVVAETSLFNPRTNDRVEVEAQINGDMSDIPRNEMFINWTRTGGLTEAEIWEQVIGLRGAQQVANDPSKLAEFATPYFNRAIFNPLTSKVAEFLDLDEFSVGLATDNLANPGVALSLSKPIIGGFSIGYEGIFRSISFPEYEFFARYNVFRNLSLRYSFDEQQTHTLQGETGFTF